MKLLLIRLSYSSGIVFGFIVTWKDIQAGNLASAAVVLSGTIFTIWHYALYILKKGG